MFWKLGRIMNDKPKWVGRVLKNEMKLKMYRFHFDTVDGKQKIKCGLAISWWIICSYTWEGELIELIKVANVVFEIEDELNGSEIQLKKL